MREAPLRRLLFVLCLILAVPPGAVMAQSSDGFLAGIPDLPLMQGLTEALESGLVFDKPGGRIVEAVAAGAVSAGEVAAFYETTLPQFGWQRGKAGTYLRDGEKLKLDIDEAAGGVTVQFTLAPQ